MKKANVLLVTAAMMVAVAGCGNPLKNLGVHQENNVQEDSLEPENPENIDEPMDDEIITYPEEIKIPTGSEENKDSKIDEDSETSDDSEIPEEYDNQERLNEVSFPIAPDDPDHLWVLDGHLYKENVRLSQYDGDVTINLGTAVEPEGAHISKLTLTQNGEILAQTKLVFFTGTNDINDGISYLNIDEIAITDSNFDGNDDFIIIGETERGREVTICEFEKAHYEGLRDSLMSDDNFSESITEKLGDDISVDRVKELLYGPDYDGTFGTYNDAYKTVLAMNQLRYGEETEEKYGLIYFNDDDIPDLIIDHAGYYLSLYVFENGKLHCPINEWGYGAGGNAGYEYYEKNATIENFNQDFAGAIYYDTYIVMDDNYEMKTAYELKGYNFDDLNGNGTPDEDEITDEALLNAEGKVEYFNYTDEELSEDEIMGKIDEIHGEFKPLNGYLTYSELLKELE